MTRSVPRPEPLDSKGRPTFLPVVLSICAAFFFSVVFVEAVRELTGLEARETSFATQVAGLLGTWLGFATGIAWVAGFSFTGLVDRLQLSIKRRDVPLGLAIGVGTQLVVITALYLPFQLFAPGVYEELGEPARRQAQQASGAATYLIFGLAVGLVAPFIEELMFRGVLLRAGLARWTAPLAVFVSSLCFAVVHFQALQTIALFTFGVILSTIVVRTRRLGLAIFAHMGFNLTTVAILALS